MQSVPAARLSIQLLCLKLQSNHLTDTSKKTHFLNLKGQKVVCLDAAPAAIAGMADRERTD
jgi:hypothetical protein